MQGPCKLLPAGEYTLTIPAREGEDLTDVNTLLSLLEEIKIRQEIKVKFPINTSLILFDLTKKTVLFNLIEFILTVIPDLKEHLVKHKGDDSVEKFNETGFVIETHIDETIDINCKLDKGFHYDITRELVNVKFNVMECHSHTPIMFIDNYLFSKHN